MRDEIMAKKRSPNSSKRRTVATRRNNQLWIGIALAVLIVVVVVARLVSDQQPAAVQQPESNSNEMPVLVSDHEYSGPPPMLIDTSKQYTGDGPNGKGR
jgi:hypothetical protein